MGSWLYIRAWLDENEIIGEDVVRQFSLKNGRTLTTFWVEFENDEDALAFKLGYL